jgi:hypothetical protein
MLSSYISVVGRRRTVLFFHILVKLHLSQFGDFSLMTGLYTMTKQIAQG